MNSQEYRNLQEAYRQVYSSQILNEFGPGDAGGSLAVKRTFGGAPGTKQNTTVSGSASLGGSNVSGSLTKGTFSGQGDKTSQGVDNALSNYNNRNVPNYKPLDTSTSTSTTGVRGTLDANVSGKIGPGSNTQNKIKAEMQKKAMLTTAANNLQAINQKKAEPDDGKPGTGTSTQLKPNDETDRATPPGDARSRLSYAGITPGDATSRRDLENRVQGPNSAKIISLQKDLDAVEGENNQAQIKQSVNPRKMERIPGTDRFRAGSLINQSFDFFDYILSHLINEGYADNEKSAKIIMENMSRVWLKSIIT